LNWIEFQKKRLAAEFVFKGYNVSLKKFKIPGQFERLILYNMLQQGLIKIALEEIWEQVDVQGSSRLNSFQEEILFNMQIVNLDTIHN